MMGHAVKATGDQREHVINLVSSVQFEPYITQRQGVAWNLFRFTVNYEVPGDFAEIARRIAELLEALAMLGPLKPPE